uniref:27 kDa hemolymph protein n=1 Tax=Culex pipiens TaxID=7175 RepID=A0A8D8DDQ7_CULPI
MTGRLLSLLIVAAVAPALFVQADDTNKIDVDKLREHLPANLQDLQIPSMDEIENAVKEKCIKAGGTEESYEQAKQGARDLANCVKGLVDIDQFRQEVEDAKPTGDLDTVFNKYCKRRAAAIECVDTFSADIDVCLDDEERESKRVFVNLVHGLLNFVCHKDGDQIALFIAEKGPECFQEQKQPLIDCFNGTLRGYLDESTPKPSEGIPKLVMGQKQCDDMDNLRACFVRVLEDCQESTPANLVESMFKFVRRETPCANFTVVSDPLR